VRELETPELKNATNGLDQFYIPSQYPAEVGGPEGPITAGEAAEALAWAEEIAAAVPYCNAELPRPLDAGGVASMTLV